MTTLERVLSPTFHPLHLFSRRHRKVVIQKFPLDQLTPILRGWAGHGVLMVLKPVGHMLLMVETDDVLPFLSCDLTSAAIKVPQKSKSHQVINRSINFRTFC
ncbi:hypothetical protein CEXT_539051 [Caerostris extrusa]|uniref:Uncharacterized protein n=1 Tax=Caerostris extrusa TaxID=172846 RepID=A0AAV4RBG9_CAEEX|nr:hypothetical protein CEXT_539051 [Caerostris extrusa]